MRGSKEPYFWVHCLTQMLAFFLPSPAVVAVFTIYQFVFLKAILKQKR